jgi:hypothetical protein
MSSAISGATVAVLGAALALAACICQADTAAPTPSEFAWRASLQLPPGASVARVAVPAPALLQLQSADARDLRIFNSAGEAVAFARMGAPAVPLVKTRSYPALPLYRPAIGSSRPKGSLQVRIDAAAGPQSVWVQMDGAEVAGAPKLSSVLFATQDEQRLLSAIDVQGTLPANTPIRISVSSSADLAQWTAAPVRGRLYRFKGDGAPVNMTLEFEQPIKLEGRYLRLDWNGQDDVSIAGVAGVVAPAAQAPARVRAELAAPQAASSGAVEIATGFLTPIAALLLSTPRENSLLPVRILGRSEASQPWRLLGQTVVYRLGTAGGETVNPPAALQGASARWLRIESTNGADLSAARLQASAEFEPMQLVFLATGAGPFELAAGRTGTGPAALPVTMIASALGSRKVEDLPAASIGPAVLRTTDEGLVARLWPGTAPGKTTVLWGVLLAGVLLLGGVAWSLFRQLNAPPPQP